MPGDDTYDVRKTGQDGTSQQEAQSLLSRSSSEDGIVANGEATSPGQYSPEPLVPSAAKTEKQHSSIVHPPPEGQARTPRTANRVRFDLEDDDSEEDTLIQRDPEQGSDSPWMEDEDYMNGGGDRDGDDTSATRSGQAMPLLTGIEAPSVTVATTDFEDPEEHLESARPRSGLQSAFMNMANSIIGAGIIGQPYAFKQAGMVMGIILLVCLTVTVDWTIRLIVVNSKLSGADSFQATMEYCFGKSGLIAISIAQWAFAFGGMIAFCIIVGDTIPQVLLALFPSLAEVPFLWLLTDRRAVIVIFVLGVSYPLSLYRDIAKLAKASTLALISMVVIVITVITQGFRVPDDSRGDIKGSLLVNDGFFQAVGVISFAFVCHHNSLLIYGSLKKPTMDRFAKVTHYSTAVSMFMCLAMALAGFLSFGSKTQGNVLNNFPRDNIMVNIARFCFGLNMLTTLPLEAFVCRSVMTTYYFPDEPFHPNRHLIFTTSLVLTSVALALITCDLGAVFELIGATSACALAYILPPLCYIKLSKSSWMAKIPSILCITFGVVVMCISLLQSAAKMIKNEGGTKTCS
ncbi:hypothetical protein FQN54_009616 [Arachnomyces sp. PD_36]|nr:hypothetical protein FQN54_009616 [Arachnomyces sp. PD_36]